MNKIVLITGATSGIGLGCARKFAANGDKLILTGRNEQRLEEIRKELTDKGHTVDLNELKKEIEQRDYNDSHRDFAPLVKAKDAIVIDTSDLTIAQVTEKILSNVKGI